MHMSSIPPNNNNNNPPNTNRGNSNSDRHKKKDQLEKIKKLTKDNIKQFKEEKSNIVIKEIKHPTQKIETENLKKLKTATFDLLNTMSKPLEKNADFITEKAVLAEFILNKEFTDPEVARQFVKSAIKMLDTHIATIKSKKAQTVCRQQLIELNNVVQELAPINLVKAAARLAAQGPERSSLDFVLFEKKEKIEEQSLHIAPSKVENYSLSAMHRSWLGGGIQLIPEKMWILGKPISNTFHPDAPFDGLITEIIGSFDIGNRKESILENLLRNEEPETNHGPHHNPEKKPLLSEAEVLAAKQKEVYEQCVAVPEFNILSAMTFNACSHRIDGRMHELSNAFRPLNSKEPNGFISKSTNGTWAINVTLVEETANSKTYKITHTMNTEMSLPYNHPDLNKVENNQIASFQEELSITLTLSDEHPGVAGYTWEHKIHSYSPYLGVPDHLINESIDALSGT